MKLKTLIASAAIAVAVLVPATTASAHTTFKVWTPQYTADHVAGSTLRWNNEAPDYVTYAECRGIGRAHYFYGEAHFRKLNCYVETADYEAFVIRVVVKTDHTATYRYLRDAF